MPTVRVHTTLGPDTLKLPELAPLLGQEVEIRVRPARKRLTADEQYSEEVRREFEAAGGVAPTLDEVHAATAGIIGSISDDIIADREDRG